VTIYSLMIESDKDTHEIEKELRELTFKGGGEVRGNLVPPKVREAFDTWFERLVER